VKLTKCTTLRRRGGARRVANGIADAAGRDFLQNADPVLARLIDARPDFRPNAWKDELPAFDAFGWLVFQIIGQQLSVRVTRTILSRIEHHYGGRVPSATEVFAADPQVLRATGMSARKVATIRAVAERFVDGRLSDQSLGGMSDEAVEALLTEIPGIGPWTARAFLMVALDRPDVLLGGDLALRRAVKRTYGFDHLPSEEEMVQIADRWRPYRSLAVSYLFASEFAGTSR
jgi:DNA-3-methyladenine glycosylase II